MGAFVGYAVTAVGLVSILSYLVSWGFMETEVTLPKDTEIDELTADERKVVLDTRPKRVLFLLGKFALIMQALLWMCFGLVLIASFGQAAVDWAARMSKEWWFVAVALALAYVLHCLRATATSAMIEMAVGAGLAITAVFGPSDGTNLSDYARLLAVLGGVYFFVQGSNNFNIHKNEETIAKSWGWLGIRINAFWEIIMNWDLTAWRSRNRWQFTYIKRAERQRRRSEGSRPSAATYE